MVQLKMSGYNEHDRHEILKSGFNAFTKLRKKEEAAKRREVAEAEKKAKKEEAAKKKEEERLEKERKKEVEKRAKEVERKAKELEKEKEKKLQCHLVHTSVVHPSQHQHREGVLKHHRRKH